MKKIIQLLTVSAITIGLLSSCSKDDSNPAVNTDITYKATLSGAAEVPANASAATGTATATLNTTTKILTVTVNYSGVTATAAHIHKAAVGVSGSVVFPFSGTLATPLTLTTVALDLTQEADLNTNLYYVNIHSAAYANGEIRGQLIKQ
jgi:L,D-peptidoglycan transpeptidase YkuD (ErfK/YbiS/YcfS/YnhG family)